MTDENKRLFRLVITDEWDSWSLQSVCIFALQSFEREAGGLLPPAAKLALETFIRECDEFKCEDTP